jgi:hypothetical protein
VTSQNSATPAAGTVAVQLSALETVGTATFTIRAASGAPAQPSATLV